MKKIVKQSAFSNRRSAISVQTLGQIIFFVFYFSLFSIHDSLVFASGGEEAPKSLLATYTPAILNFLILVALLVFMMKKMDIKGYFRKRTELIEQSLKEAREAKELAQRLSLLIKQFLSK